MLANGGSKMFYPKAILFDLDDTIIDFTTTSSKTWIKVSNEFVRNHPVTFTAEELFVTIETTRSWFWSNLYKGRIKRDSSVSEICQMLTEVLKLMNYHDLSKAIELADSFSKLYIESLAFFKGAEETLKKIKSLKIRMALITNGDRKKQRAQIEYLNLSKFFEIILIDSELGFSKPDPRIFNLALEKLSLNADEVWMVGDNLRNDIYGAQNVGIYSIWNDFKGTGLTVNSDIVPNKVINSISEILKYLPSTPITNSAIS